MGLQAYAIYTLIILFFILASFVYNKKDQMKVFILFMAACFIKWVATYYVNKFGLDVNDRFLANNTLRVIQHTFLSFFAYYAIYSDYRAIPLFFVNTMISVFYTASTFGILSNNWVLQNVIYDYRYVMSAVIMLSMIDYGDKVYAKTFNYFSNTPFKYLNNISKYYYSQINDKKTEKGA